MSIKPKNATHFTAGELVEALSKLPPETPLYVRGYEYGLDYVTALQPVKVEPYVNNDGDAWWAGQHDDCPDRDADTESGYELQGWTVEAPDAR